MRGDAVSLAPLPDGHYLVTSPRGDSWAATATTSATTGIQTILGYGAPRRVDELLRAGYTLTKLVPETT